MLHIVNIMDDSTDLLADRSLLLCDSLFTPIQFSKLKNDIKLDLAPSVSFHCQYQKSASK